MSNLTAMIEVLKQAADEEFNSSGARQSQDGREREKKITFALFNCAAETMLNIERIADALETLAQKALTK